MWNGTLPTIMYLGIPEKSNFLPESFDNLKRTTKLFIDTDGERALVVAFNHRFQNCSFHALRPRWHLCCFAYSCLKLKPIHTTNLNATPSLKPDETGFMFDCCGVRLAEFWVSSISSITEPNRSQSNDWSSIEFDYRTFDQLGRQIGRAHSELQSPT